MTVTTTGMSGALESLHQALDAPRRPDDSGGTWRSLVGQRMAVVHDALAAEAELPDEDWLAPRRGSVLRERNALLGRLGALRPVVLESPDLERVRSEIQRLLSDISRHIQRLHDLAYDAVELELGGEQ